MTINKSDVSLIITTKNESDNIKMLLECIFNQTIIPNEIVIVDGGSLDNTTDIIKDYCNVYENIHLIKHDGINISEGRNIAIKHATNEIILATDAGCKLKNDWVEQMVTPFIDDQSIDVVWGWDQSNSKTKLEEYITILTFPKVEEIDKEKYLPASRNIAFKKSAWEKVGGYPEFLYTAEDTLFDINLKKCGCKFYFNENAIVYWRPRRTLKSLWKQFKLYHQGNRRAKLYKNKYYVFFFYNLALLLFLSLSFYKAYFMLVELAFLLIPFVNMIYLKRKDEIKSLEDFLITWFIWVFINTARFYGAFMSKGKKYST